MGTELHEPVGICWPEVGVFPMQVLMKLLEEVSEAAWPAVVFSPSLFSKLLTSTVLSKP